MNVREIVAAQAIPECWFGEIGIDELNRVYLVPGGIHATMVGVRDAGEPIDIACVPVDRPDGRMTRQDAARYLGFAEKTLAMRWMQGLPPRGVKIGGRVFYFLDDLDAFIRGE